jgi:transcriptional regulator with XRE-family HTH domain
MVEVAAACGVSVETLRKIETGRIPTPALFTVAAVAATLDLSLDELVAACHDQERAKHPAGDLIA